MNCPACSDRLEVSHSVRRAAEVVRRRRCKNCGFAIRTVERPWPAPRRRAISHAVFPEVQLPPLSESPIPVIPAHSVPSTLDWPPESFEEALARACGKK